VNVNAIGNAGLNQNPCGYETNIGKKATNKMRISK
jgi:hypothetical protein